MDSVLAEQRAVTRIWHPAPPNPFASLGRDMYAAVLVGNPAYQVTTGEIVAL